VSVYNVVMCVCCVVRECGGMRVLCVLCGMCGGESVYVVFLVCRVLVWCVCMCCVVCECVVCVVCLCGDVRVLCST